MELTKQQKTLKRYNHHHILHAAAAAATYYHHHLSLSIPRIFMTLDNIIMKDNGVKWVKTIGLF